MMSDSGSDEDVNGLTVEEGGSTESVRKVGLYCMFIYNVQGCFITQESSLILTLDSLKFFWYYVNTIVYNYYYHLVPYTKPSDTISLPALSP